MRCARCLASLLVVRVCSHTSLGVCSHRPALVCSAYGSGPLRAARTSLDTLGGLPTPATVHGDCTCRMLITQLHVRNFKKYSCMFNRPAKDTSALRFMLPHAFCGIASGCNRMERQTMPSGSSIGKNPPDNSTNKFPGGGYKQGEEGEWQKKCMRPVDLPRCSAREVAIY